MGNRTNQIGSDTLLWWITDELKLSGIDANDFLLQKIVVGQRW